MDKTTASVPRQLTGFRQIVSHYRAVVCDLWGVLHDGVTPYPAASDCLGHMRTQGLTTVLLSNSPKRGQEVKDRLGEMGIDTALFHGPVTAGDLAHAAVAQHPGGTRVFHLGPPRDNSLRAGLDVVWVDDPDQADLVLCSGLIDDQEIDIDWHQPLLEQIARRGLSMICANPDRIVEMGDRLIPCAGALADVYERLGGTVIWCGKPMAAAYDHVTGLLRGLAGAALGQKDILAIGDGIFTDIKGAAGYGIASLLLTHGVHRHDHGIDQSGRITLKGHDGPIIQPTYVMDRLIW